MNLVLLQAIRDKASDIHFEPFENEYKMRYRIDGVLYEMVPPPKYIAAALSSRIKVMANLDIAERTTAAGRTHITYGGRQSCGFACECPSDNVRRERGIEGFGPQPGKSQPR